MNLLFRLMVLCSLGFSRRHLVHCDNRILNDDRPPTASPAPTESPAPSPSPSEIPTSSPAPTITARPTEWIPPPPSPTPTESPAPSPSPSEAPTATPSSSKMPSDFPSLIPTNQPSTSSWPSSSPSVFPSRSLGPTGIMPSDAPYLVPPVPPSSPPTMKASWSPPVYPSQLRMISIEPTNPPSPSPTASLFPSAVPTIQPSSGPSHNPSTTPTKSIYPSIKPTDKPTLSAAPSTTPSEQPSASPTALPSGFPTLSTVPSNLPTSSPTESIQPSSTPSISTSKEPSFIPSDMPSWIPSRSPTLAPTHSPSAAHRQLLANTTVTLYSVSGPMDGEGAASFEETSLLLLRGNFPKMSHFEIDFLDIQVMGQVFQYDDRRLVEGESIGNLNVYFRIVAAVYPGEPTGFDFQWSMESFFKAQEKNLAAQLEDSDVFFQPSLVEGSVNSQGRGGLEEENAWSDFFTTPVVIGISVGIAAVLVLGAFVISRVMWGNDIEGYHLESPGRLGAAPSYDSEDQRYRDPFYSEELSVVDPQSIFLSLSQVSKPHVNNDEHVGRRTPSAENSSTSGSSHLAGLDIHYCQSVSSAGSVSRGAASPHDGTTHPLDNYDAVWSRSRSIMEDIVSQSYSDTSSSKDLVEGQWDIDSSQNFSIQVATSNEREQSIARKKKRQLEKRLRDSKMMASHTMESVPEEEQLDSGHQSGGVSMKDLLLATSSLNVDVNWDVDDHLPISPSISSSQPAQSVISSLPGESPVLKYSTSDMTFPELVELAEHIPVDHSTPKGTKMKLYDRIRDVAGAVLETVPEADDIESQTSPTSENDSSVGNSKTPSKSPMSWFRRSVTPNKPPLSESVQSSAGGSIEKTKSSGSRSFSLFGKGSKRQDPWERAKEFNPLSPLKRYRRGEHGQLVPRRFKLLQDGSEDENEIEASDEDENHDYSETLLLDGSNEIDESPNDPSMGGITATPERHRPPKLDLNDLEDDEDDYSDRSDEVETPLVAHPVPSAQGVPLVYGQGMVYGQDPDGFALTNYNKRFGVVGSSSSDPSQEDPPTASEHRRTVAALMKSLAKEKGGNKKKKNKHKSALRQMGSPRRSIAERVSFMELPVESNEDAIILGSMNVSDSNTELEWGNMI